MIALTRIASCLVLSVALLAMPLAADAKIVVPSKHRKIKNGIGNCVFSTRPLPLKRQNGYKLKTSFTAPEKVYSRCYYAKTMGEYKSVGKLKSQLRGDGWGHSRRAPAGYSRRLQFQPRNWYYAHTVRLNSRNANWDQGRADILPSGRCDFKKKPRTGACIDLAKEVRGVAKQMRASLPYTAKICLYTEFEVVNKKKPNPKNRLQLIDKKQFHIVSKGCFKYTVKK